MIDMFGRAAEAAIVARFAERVPNGPVGVLVEGEPGIGKTTVMLQAVHAAHERRYRVLQAQPAEAESDLSFATLGDLVGGLFHEVRDALPAPQRQALEVALMLREADEPADPLTTASALLTALTILSSASPLVVAIDDAQWMDQASKRALEFSVRRLPPRLGVVVSSRVEDGVATPLDLERALGPGSLERLLLAPGRGSGSRHLKTANGGQPHRSGGDDCHPAGPMGPHGGGPRLPAAPPGSRGRTQQQLNRASLPRRGAAPRR